MKIKKTRLGVIFGGVGPEHEASLSSAKALQNHLSHEFEIAWFGITKNGGWIEGRGAWDCLYKEANEKLLPRAIRGLPTNTKR